jgi:predicted MFS family arabinose efflux permease
VLAVIIGWVLITESRLPSPGRPDVIGAVLSTAGLSLAVYGVVQSEQVGWLDPHSGGLIGLAGVLIVAFIFSQTRASDPLVPLRIFRLRDVSIGNTVTALVGAVGQIVYFTLTLYLQRVLGWGPLTSGLVFLPVSVGIFAASIPFARYIQAVGLRNLLFGGFTLMLIGLLMLARTPQNPAVVTGILLPATAWGIGFGLTQSGAFIAAARGVPEAMAGVASGLIATTYRIGGALGLGTMVAVATAHSTRVNDQMSPTGALAAGYSYAFWGAAALTVIGALTTLWLRADPEATMQSANDVKPDRIRGQRKWNSGSAQ